MQVLKLYDCDRKMKIILRNMSNEKGIVFKVYLSYFGPIGHILWSVLLFPDI